MSFWLISLITITGIVWQVFSLLLLSQLFFNHRLEALFFSCYWYLLCFVVIILWYGSSFFHLWFLYLRFLSLLNWFFDWRLITLWFIRVFAAVRLLLLLIIFWRMRGIFGSWWLEWLNIFIRIRFNFFHRICIRWWYWLDRNVLITLWSIGWFLSTHSCSIHFFL